MTSRRSFLRRIASSIAALALAPSLCRLAEQPVVAATLPPRMEGMAMLRDVYPARFFWDNAAQQYIRVNHFVNVQRERAVLTMINKDWIQAPYEQQIWLDDKEPERNLAIIVDRAVGMPLHS